MMALFIMLFLFWVYYDFNEKIFVFLNAVFGSVVTLLRVVQKPNTMNIDQISAEHIDTAKTESGDVNLGSTKPLGGK